MSKQRSTGSVTGNSKNTSMYVRRPDPNALAAVGPFLRRRPGGYAIRAEATEDNTGVTIMHGLFNSIEQGEKSTYTRDQLTVELHHGRGIGPATFNDLCLIGEYLTPRLAMLPGQESVLDSGRFLRLTETPHADGPTTYTIDLINARAVVSTTLEGAWRDAATAIYLPPAH